MSNSLIALIDIGKTNARLSCIDPRTGAEVRGSRRANAVVQTALCRELDVVAIEQWLLEALRDAPHKERITTIAPVAHGAAAVLVDRDDKIVAAPDYEDACFESVGSVYRRERDPYAETFSPDLPLGLNLGRQLFWLQETEPQLFDRAAHILLYPQFWAWRLSGVMASEATSLGCHSDLWRPRENSYSQLARSRGWVSRLPTKRLASDVLGPITPAVAAATGLNPQCQVACGIHDSNASYLNFLAGRNRDEPFAVVSSGTWTVVMANRADLGVLREERDMLANVDAFGSPVATARFMGGREYEAIAGGDAQPNLPALLNVIERGALALPTFAAGGPFSGRPGELLNADGLSGSERAALATLYVVLMTELLIESLGARGDILIDGPLAKNPCFGPLLAALLPSSNVLLCTGDSNTRALCYLGGFPDAPSKSPQRVQAVHVQGLADYRASWRRKT